MVDPLPHPANHLGQRLPGHVGDRGHRQGSQAAGQERLDRLEPGPDHSVPELQELVAPRERPAVDARQVGSVRLGPQEDREAPRRQVVAVVQERIRAKKPARETGLMAGLELDVRQPGLGPVHPENLFGLGGDRREMGVDHGDPTDRPEAGEGQPVGGDAFDQEFRRRLVRFGHVSEGPQDRPGTGA